MCLRVRTLVAARLCARRANCAAPSHTPALSEPQASPNDQYIRTILHKVNLGWGRPRDPQRPKALPRIQTKSREIDPNEYQQWRTGISPPQSPSVSCFGLTGPLTDRTRHFIPCWRAL